MPYPPYIIRPGEHPYGIDSDIMDTVASRLNFKLTYVKTGTFNELVGAAFMGRVDMSLGHAGIVWPRFNLGLDCTSMFIRNVHFGQRHPVPVDTFYAITYPFETTLWVCGWVTVLFVCVVLGTLNRYSEISVNRESDQEDFCF